MTRTLHIDYPFSFNTIDIGKIDPSPFQHRKYFDGKSISQDVYSE
ncbi:hypothetical protein [Desulfobacula sp.]